MEIQKYKAKIKGSDIEVVGYITEIRERLGEGCYGTGTDYLITVTEKSMSGGNYGTFNVEKQSIEFYNEVLPSKDILRLFETRLLKLINFYCRLGLSKTDLVRKMEYTTDSCRMS